MASRAPLSLLLAAMSLLAGCTGSRSPAAPKATLETPERFSIVARSDASVFRTVFDAPADRVWDLLPAVYRELGYPGASATNTTDRTFITPNMAIRGRLYPGEYNSTYLDCGTVPIGPRADVYEVHFVMVTRVREGPGDTTVVETIVDGRARDRAGNGMIVPCAGTGKLEKAVADRLRRKLNL
jgi:hypothetical protein